MVAGEQEARTAPVPDISLSFIKTLHSFTTAHSLCCKIFLIYFFFFTICLSHVLIYLSLSLFYSISLACALSFTFHLNPFSSSLLFLSASLTLSFIFLLLSFTSAGVLYFFFFIGHHTVRNMWSAFLKRQNVCVCVFVQAFLPMCISPPKFLFVEMNVLKQRFSCVCVCVFVRIQMYVYVCYFLCIAAEKEVSC